MLGSFELQVARAIAREPGIQGKVIAARVGELARDGYASTRLKLCLSALCDRRVLEQPDGLGYIVSPGFVAQAGALLR